MTYAVVIPAYNADRTIAEALDSVLAQTVPPSEIVVVDDGSTDGTVEIVRSYSKDVRLISQANSGCGPATTNAIKATSSQIIAMIDADDIWMPTKMAVQLRRLEELGARAISFTRSRQFRHGDIDRENGVERDGLGRSTLVMRKTVFDEVGPIIDPPNGVGDMVDWLARARDAGFVLDVLPEVLSLRRIIPGSMTYAGVELTQRGYLAVARAAILRRRQADQK